KNTCYILAKRSNHSLENIEAFAREIVVHFLSTYPHVDGVDVQLESHNWTRIRTTTLQPVTKTSPGTAVNHGFRPTSTSGFDHPHSFYRGSDEKRVVKLVGERVTPYYPDPRDKAKGLSIRFQMESGMVDLYVLKTTGSSFENFHRDEYTTLKDASDRLFSTKVKCMWKYPAVTETVSASGPGTMSSIPYTAIWNGVKQIVLDVFSNHDSPSVQYTLYRMGQIALETYPEIVELSYELPNIHVFGYDLDRFPLGLKNTGKDQNIFYPVSDPSGEVERRWNRFLQYSRVIHKLLTAFSFFLACV
ncbi:hypothetical protein HK102_011044, partial [Quaeritorhiza haematococci]